ncbi:MAG: tetratricopeptide repeat protein [Candidatus Competibacteraceae bacterium]|nr:tetratricopeptide repeat protein [Candidatus Competibacteraceae bacterium]
MALLVVVLAGLFTGTVVVLARAGIRVPQLLNQPSQQKILIDLWKAKNYQEVVRITDEILTKDAMEAGALTFNGFASFYLGMSQASIEDRLPYLSKAVQSLRRARLCARCALRGEAEYILGKAYYHRGKFYYDQAAVHLQNSLDASYTGDDTHEYLGLAYSGLGKYEESLKHFEAAIEKRPSDLLYLTLAQTHYQLEDYTAAEEYLLRCVNSATDTAILQKAHSMLGGIYLQRKDYLKAESHFQKLLDYNAKSAEACFSLGEIYFALGDTAKARAFWRRTLAAEPKHYGALRRLYG